MYHLNLTFQNFTARDYCVSVDQNDTTSIKDVGSMKMINKTSFEYGVDKYRLQFYAITV